MKTTLITIVCGLVLGFAPGAWANVLLAPGDSWYLGFVQGGDSNSNPTTEAGKLNTLITLAAGSGPILLTPPAGGTNYDRRQSTLTGPFTPVSLPLQPSDYSTVEVPPGTPTGINVTGWTYILGKYNGPSVGVHVWYVKGLTGNYDLPSKLGDPVDNSKAKGLSHYVLFNSTPVPDGGVTLMLLGGALVTLESLRRKLRCAHRF